MRLSEANVERNRFEESTYFANIVDVKGRDISWKKYSTIIPELDTASRYRLLLWLSSYQLKEKNRGKRRDDASRL